MVTPHTHKVEHIMEMVFHDWIAMTGHVETVCLLSNTQRPKKESYITLDVEKEDYYRIKDSEKEQGKK